MARLIALRRSLRFRTREPDVSDKLADRRLDAITHDMVGGKGLSPTGAVMDFERDSEPRR